MEEKITKVDELKRLQERLPFLIFLPRDYNIEDVTFRRERPKWSTIRFYCKVEGERIRAKEFFLDWFYSGFPKSLMESFVSTYSNSRSIDGENGISFLGKNYKGKAASSTFSLGTQIEIEGDSEMAVETVTRDLLPLSLPKRFEGFPFCKRSFFARGGRPEWFEEERVSRMTWSPLGKDFSLENLKGDSLGIFRSGGLIAEEVAILSEPYFKRVIWIDTSNSASKERHLHYELREGGNFFHTFIEGEGKLAFRAQTGPAIFQNFNEGKTMTISFSPLFSLTEVKLLLPELIELGKRIENSF